MRHQRIVHFLTEPSAVGYRLPFVIRLHKTFLDLHFGNVHVCSVHTRRIQESIKLMIDPDKLFELFVNVCICQELVNFVQSSVFLYFPFQFCSNIFLVDELFQRRRHHGVPHKIYAICGVSVTVSIELGVDSYWIELNS